MANSISNPSYDDGFQGGNPNPLLGYPFLNASDILDNTTTVEAINRRSRCFVQVRCVDYLSMPGNLKSNGTGETDPGTDASDLMFLRAAF